LRIPRPHRRKCEKILQAAMCVFAGSSQVGRARFDDQKSQAFLLCFFFTYYTLLFGIKSRLTFIKYLHKITF